MPLEGQAPSMQSENVRGHGGGGQQSADEKRWGEGAKFMRRLSLQRAVRQRGLQQRRRALFTQGRRVVMRGLYFARFVSPQCAGDSAKDVVLPNSATGCPNIVVASVAIVCRYSKWHSRRCERVVWNSARRGEVLL